MPTKDYLDVLKKMNERKLIKLGKKAIELAVDNSEWADDHAIIVLREEIEKLTNPKQRKLAPISKRRQRKLTEFTKEVSKSYKNGSSYMARTDIKIN